MSQAVKLNKELYSNLREAVYKIISGWIVELDSDNGFVVYEGWDAETGSYKDYKVSYAYDGQVATLTGEPVEVVVKNVVEEVSQDSSIQKMFKSLKDDFIELKKSVALSTTNFTSLANPTSKEAAPVEVMPIIKQLDDEEMIAIEPLYISFGEVDGHGDALESQEEVYKMVDSFNQSISDGHLKYNYDHGEFCEDFVAVKAWVNEVDCHIGDTFVPEGQPIVKTQFLDKDKWEERKAGDVKGVSIQASAICIEVEDE